MEKSQDEQEVPDSILEKIQKLMTLKENAGASQGEIENASKMITALLLKYNLSLSQVENHKGKDKRPIGKVYYDLNGTQTRHEADWINSLYNVIAQFNLCKAIKVPGRDKDDMGKIILVGRAHNIEIVHYLVDQLRFKIRSCCRLAWSIYKRQGDEKVNTFKRGFFRGAVNGIYAQLTELQEQMISSGINTDNSLGLMIISEREAMQKWAEDNIGIKEGGSHQKLKGIDANAMGYHTGRNMNINKGIGGQGTRGHLN